MAESGTKPPELDEVDSGWEEQDDVDSGWEDAEAAETTARAPRGLTEQEREARAARAADRKVRHRAKAAEKAQRRKAREAAAAAKQKKSSPRTGSAARATGPERGARPANEEQHGAVRPRQVPDAPAASTRRPIARLAVPLVLLLVASCVVAFVLARR